MNRSNASPQDVIDITTKRFGTLTSISRLIASIHRIWTRASIYRVVLIVVYHSATAVHLPKLPTMTV
jgi:hypothetical protein